MALHRRAILMGLAGLSLTVPDVTAKKRHKKRTALTVEDRTVRWSAPIAATVAAYNAVMPKGGPRLRYVRGEAAIGPCLPSRKKSRIHICEHATHHLPLGVPGETTAGWADAGARTITLDDTTTPSPRMVCHELMHILTRVGDNYGAKPDTSCVWGGLSTPGAWDVKQLAKRFKRKRKG